MKIAPGDNERDWAQMSFHFIPVQQKFFLPNSHLPNL